MSRFNTKLFSSGAEFLVLSKMLLAGIESYKAYVNQEGYDLLAVNPLKNKSATIQVKSKNFKGDSSFRLGKKTLPKVDFYVFAQTNSLTRKHAIIPDSDMPPNLYVIDVKTVKKYKKTDKKGNQYLLLSSLKDRNIYKDDWGSIKKFIK